MNPSTFDYDDSDFIHQTAQWVDKMAPQESEFDKRLMQQWQAAMDAGAFRYNVDNVQIRTIPGPKHYLALLNELRGVERRRPQQIMSISQPVNPDAFNFNKVKSDEIIFNLNHTVPTSDSNGVNGVQDGENQSHNNTVKMAKVVHSILINNSPVNKGHCLLVPEKNLCNPQILTQTAFKVAIETTLLSRHRGFCVGFNSLLAYASVNHQHWHVIYIPQQLLVHHCPLHHLAGRFHEFTTYPVPGFALQLHGSSISELARQAHKISSYLHESDIAHNAFVCRGVVFGEEATSSLTTVRLFIWPRKKYIGDSTQGDPAKEPFNLACVELAGFLVMKDAKSYETYTEADVDAYFSAFSLEPEDYKRIRDHVIALGSDNPPSV